MTCGVNACGGSNSAPQTSGVNGPDGGAFGDMLKGITKGQSISTENLGSKLGETMGEEVGGMVADLLDRNKDGTVDVGEQRSQQDQPSAEKAGGESKEGKSKGGGGCGSSPAGGTDSAGGPNDIWKLLGEILADGQVSKEEQEKLQKMLGQQASQGGQSGSPGTPAASSLS